MGNAKRAVIVCSGPIDDDEYWDELQKHIAVSRLKTAGDRVLNTEGTYGSK